MADDAFAPWPWPDGPGIVTLPYGIRIRGRGLRRSPTPGPDPTLGIYLLGREPEPMPWPSLWVRWPDFRRPSDPDKAIEVLRRGLIAAETGRVEIACRGGRGRTGTAIAALAVLTGIHPTAAVAWTRTHYHPHAIETPTQRRWIQQLPES